MTEIMFYETSKELVFQSDPTNFISEIVIQVLIILQVFCFELGLLSHLCF